MNHLEPMSAIAIAHGGEPLRKGEAGSLHKLGDIAEHSRKDAGSSLTNGTENDLTADVTRKLSYGVDTEP